MSTAQQTKEPGCSLVILPFNWLGEPAPKNPFREDLPLMDQVLPLTETADRPSICDWLLKMYSFRNENVLDNLRYHPFVANYLSTLKMIDGQPQVGNGFLRHLEFDLDKLKGRVPVLPPADEAVKKDAPIPYSAREYNFGGYMSLSTKQETYLTGRGGAFVVPFRFAGISVFVNELMRSGFLVFQINWVSAEKLSERLADITFFRWLDLPNKKPWGSANWAANKEAYIGIRRTVRTNNENPNAEPSQVGEIPADQFTLFELTNGFLNDFYSRIIFNKNKVKPVMLHLLTGEESAIRDGEWLIRFFNILRIPPKAYRDTSESETGTSIQVHHAGPAVVFCAMNEGSVMVDGNCEKTELAVKQYLPAFLLALNQREVMVSASRLISELRDQDLLQREAQTGLVERLGQLRRIMNVVQLKQIFYSISFYHEVEQFFLKVQEIFDVNTLLADNKVSIEGIHDLLEQDRNRQEEEEEKRNSRRQSIFFGALSLLTVVSAMTDGYAFFGIEEPRWIFFPVILLVMALFFFRGMDRDKK